MNRVGPPSAQEMAVALQAVFGSFGGEPTLATSTPSTNSTDSPAAGRRRRHANNGDCDEDPPTTDVPTADVPTADAPTTDAPTTA